MTSSIIKDGADIWFRLFDHRPFLSGEINQFLKNHEICRHKCVFLGNGPNNFLYKVFLDNSLNIDMGAQVASPNAIWQVAVAPLWASLYIVVRSTDELQDSKGDREVGKLFEVLEWATEVRDVAISKSLLSSDKLEKINTLLEIAIQNSNTVVDNESSYSVDRALEAKRAARKLEWEKFMHDIDSRYTKIEDTFRGKEQELSEFYKDLEQKFHVN